MARKDYRPVVDAMADKYGVPREYVRAIYEIESNSGKNPGVSSAGAKGHMQLLPGTAKEMGVRDINDPVQNIEGGVKYYASMLKMFGDPVVAAAAYNAGPGNVAKARGIPRFKETQNYVRKFASLVNTAPADTEMPGEPTQIAMNDTAASEPKAVPTPVNIDREAVAADKFRELLLKAMSKRRSKKTMIAPGILDGIA